MKQSESAVPVPMRTRRETRAILLDVFDDVGLMIGGLFAVHDMDDDLVWRLMRNLDVIRERGLKKIAGEGAAPSVNLKPHPAIEEFLRRGRLATGLYAPSDKKENDDVDVPPDVP